MLVNVITIFPPFSCTTSQQCFTSNFLSDLPSWLHSRVSTVSCFPFHLAGYPCLLLFLLFSFHPSPSFTQTLNIGFLQNSTVNFSTFYTSHTTTDSFADSDLHVCISRPLTSEAFISCSSLYPSTMYRGRLNWRLLAAMNSGHRGRNIRGSATGSTVERCVANILSHSDLSAHLFQCLDRYF